MRKFIEIAKKVNKLPKAFKIQKIGRIIVKSEIRKHLKEKEEV